MLNQCCWYIFDENSAHITVLLSPAGVHVVFTDAASEEALAAITAGRPVVFACRSVPTDGTQAACCQVAGGTHVGALSRRGVYQEEPGTKMKKMFHWLNFTSVDIYEVT